MLLKFTPLQVLTNEQGMAKDAIKAKALLNDPKEVAEHNMLVDLARNDLSKYCSEVELKLPNKHNFILMSFI